MTGQDTGGLQQWLAEHTWFTYLFMVISMIYIFNTVFRPRKLPLLKDLIVYVLILLGGWLLLFFQTKVGLPIVHGFAVAIVLMLTVRIRSWFTKRGQKGGAGSSSGVRQEPGRAGQQVQQVQAIHTEETDR